jgi:hypothetical protein
MGPSADTRHRTGSVSSSAASGTDGEAKAIGGGVKRSAGATVGEGGSGVAQIGVDGPCSGGDSGGGVRSIGDVIALNGAIELVGEASRRKEKEGEYPPPPRSLTERPHIASSPPSSSVLQAAEME